ncbi:MAG: DUF4976 domain-containing protein [Bacteroidetes bacterium]|nr:MAG: DUF4976 domain-containing protein [Bacteroidota bacterium]
MLLLTFCLAQKVSTQPLAKKPNVIIILADDLGWADLQCNGSTFYETPNLNALTQAGTNFTQAYATSPVCSPTRASLLTGKLPVKTGITDWIPGRHANGNAKPYEKMLGATTANALALQENTLAEQLQHNGYTTFFAGKWHLGDDKAYWPEQQGFATNIGGWGKGSPTGRINDSTGGYFTPYKNPQITDGPPGEYLTNRLTDACLNFIDTNKNRPFLLLYSMYAVHNPLQAPRSLIDKYLLKRAAMPQHPQSTFVKDEPWMEAESGWQRRTVQENAVYAAMVENMDDNVGKIMRKLKALGIDDNTIVIFTSDNGGLSTAEGSPTANGPLRAGKGWLYEGGIRVPFILYWKGKLAQTVTADMPITLADIFPTVAKAADKTYKKPAALDGDDILQARTKKNTTKNRPLFWHYPHYSNQGGRPAAAIRLGNWKLIYNYEDQLAELYDLKHDVGEQNNLATQQTAKLASLKAMLMQWLKTNKALGPTPNTAYKPNP